MKFRSHRGGVYYTPENTMPAFRAAFAAGYESIETDPQYTRDGVVVLMHDASINRTCRNADGSPIERPVYVANSTYEELLSYDAGIAKGEAFRGTKIPRLDELLALLDGSGTILCLDKKIPDDDMDRLFDVVAKYHAEVEFSVKDIARTRIILERFPNARINYDGDTKEADLEAILSLVPRERLSVWVYLDKPNFAWLTDRDKASPEVCARVKKYAMLGIANVSAPEDVREAMLLGADMIEV